MGQEETNELDCVAAVSLGWVLGGAKPDVDRA
jgi:hypothetical protein